MAEKQRYTVSIPDHVSGELEQHAKAIGATPTEYAGDVLRWWYGQGCPPVRPDEIELRKRILPAPTNLDVWHLDPEKSYELIDDLAEKVLSQLGMRNLFAQRSEFDAGRLMVAFDNHPTHWLMFNYFQGGKTKSENGLAFSALPKSSVRKEDMLLRLTIEAHKMESKDPITFSQIPLLEDRSPKLPTQKHAKSK